MYNGPFRSDMPITLLHLMLMSKIYVVNSDMKNVIHMSDLNVMFKGPGPLPCKRPRAAKLRDLRFSLILVWL